MKTEKLSSLVTFLPRSKMKAGEALEKGDYLFFTSSDVKRSYINDYIYDDELLILGTGGFASCNYYRGKFAVSTDNFVLKTHESILPKYLYYYLRKDNLSLLANGFRGVGIKHISKKYVSNLDVPVCEIESQKKIIKVLDDVSSLISNEKEDLIALDSLIKSRFNEMFGDCDLHDQKERWVKLDDVTTIYTGTTPSTANSENWGGDILWVTPAEIKDDDFIISTTERTITEVGRRSKSLEIMPRGTVLLSTRAPIGKVAIAGNPMTCNQGFKNFLCGDRLNNMYLYYLLRYNNEFLNSIGTGTTFKEVSRSKIANVKIPVPPIDLQNVFASFVEKVDKLKFTNQRERHILQP